MLKIQIKKWFEEAVRLDTVAHQDLKDAVLRASPRVDVFINNLVKEFQAAEKLCKAKGLTLKLKTMQDATYDMTKVFLTGMEGEARRRYESDFDKTMRQIKADQEKEFDAVLAGKAEGEFAEAGVISNEEIDNQRQIV